MTEFKIGDKVLVIVDTEDNTCPQSGSMGTIIGIDSDGNRVEFLNGDWRYFQNDELEPLKMRSRRYYPESKNEHREDCECCAYR